MLGVQLFPTTKGGDMPEPRTGQVVNPNWDITPKHNMRFSDDIWKPAMAKVKRLKRAGYATSVVAMLRPELTRIATEDDAETIKRLGLKKDGEA